MGAILLLMTIGGSIAALILLAMMKTVFAALSTGFQPRIRRGFSKSLTAARRFAND